MGIAAAIASFLLMPEVVVYLAIIIFATFSGFVFLECVSKPKISLTAWSYFNAAMRDVLITISSYVCALPLGIYISTGNIDESIAFSILGFFVSFWIVIPIGMIFAALARCAVQRFWKAKSGGEIPQQFG